MKINRTADYYLIFALIALLATFALYYFSLPVQGSAPTGLQASVATSSPHAIGARTASTLFATSSCAARIITTSGSPIMLTFSNYSNQSPTGVFGHLQAASTTEVYDGGQYGCGLVKAYSDTAQNLTLTETR